MPALPALRRLCQCWQCYDAPSTDPVTGFPVKGVYLKQSQYDIHQLQATEVGIASPAQSTTVLGAAPPSSSPQASGLVDPSTVHLVLQWRSARITMALNPTL
ncbi:hypothetical protein BDN71DRAFT_1434384 [Pleurotus eryngii]|uniref:Uncharacterized protein n=1 Tax=Pleurotus eryngii TaxID=5323 RepID=A0A9P6DCK3_PLEER|nr:hypothetical protein BDN71DRAFT_1434384 [Pleurotus eryngii]